MSATCPSHLILLESIILIHLVQSKKIMKYLIM
jgi:hypothetical protein